MENQTASLKPRMQQNLPSSTDVYNEVFEIAKTLNPNFVIDDNIKNTFSALVYYFNRDPEFENQGYGKLQKGILLLGNVGTGKTFLMNAFSKRFDHIIIKSTNKLNDDYQAFGVEGIKDNFFIPHKHILNYEGDFIKKFFGVCYDDFGSEEPEAVHMGNRISVMAKIIKYRYERPPFRYTYLTSNLTLKEIEAVYGTRIKSRLIEMCNILVLSGNDRRI